MKKNSLARIRKRMYLAFGINALVIVLVCVLGFLLLKQASANQVTYDKSVLWFVVGGGILLLLSIALGIFFARGIIKSAADTSYWYENILDSIPFPLSVTDMNMNWTFINKPVEQMLGIKRADVLGKQCENWGAAICNTDNCGINCLRKNKNRTRFEQFGGEYQVDVSYLHDSKNRQVGHIEVVQDISEMMKNQKAQTELVNKINALSESFASATGNIADGAQTLSQGSVEQAASVSQLSQSIMKVSEKTDTNTKMAERASVLADTIRMNAETGSEDMNRMMKAVDDINEAGKAINKVIKVIDDIAFQTNILALNASVEAARAGSHGKGFAVVAGEVRNLAQKSAEAAKNTGELIENSIEKAELGAKISKLTAASLEKIVSGIIESNELIGEIAKSSIEQNEAINQISTGIGKVANVVQQNSATAEQSAAISEELNNQTDLLRKLLDDFSTQSK